MSRYSQRSESAEVTPVSQGDQTKRDDDEQDSLLVNVPAKQKRCVTT
jgi:hypothetical protein